MDVASATAPAFTAYRGIDTMVPDGSYRGVVEFFHVGPLGPVPASEIAERMENINSQNKTRPDCSKRVELVARDGFEPPTSWL